MATEAPSTDCVSKGRAKECFICQEDSDLFPLPCPNHAACQQCLRDYFKYLLKGKSCWPFTCCGEAEEIPIALFEALFDKDFVEQYKDKEEEYNTDKPLYCAEQRCSTFLPPLSWNGAIAKCQKCNLLTCPRCSGLIDQSTDIPHRCENDTEGEKALLPVADVKPCPSCRIPIQLKDACNHMTCSQCKHQFCFICVATWTGKCRNNCPQYGIPEVDDDGYTKDWVISPKDFRPGGYHKNTGFDIAGRDRSGFDQNGVNGRGERLEDPAAGRQLWNAAANDGHDDDDEQFQTPFRPQNPAIFDEANRNRWRQERLVEADEVRWGELPADDLLEEHEQAQMQLDIDNGLFVPTGEAHHDVEGAVAGDFVGADLEAEDPAEEAADNDQLPVTDNNLVTLANDHDVAVADDPNIDGNADVNLAALEDEILAALAITSSSVPASTASEADDFDVEIIGDYYGSDSGAPTERNVRAIVAQRLRDYLASRSGHESEDRKALVGRGGGYIFDIRGEANSVDNWWGRGSFGWLPKPDAA